ncbi:INO80 complex subunit 2 [Cercospora zeina]
MPPARRSARTVSNPVTAARASAEPYSRTNARVVSSSASIARPAAGKTSLRLTVKAPPSKLRQATSGSALPPNPYADNQSESDATPAPPRRTARATRNPRTVVDHDSDEMDEDQDAEGEVEEEEADVSNGQDASGIEDSEQDAEGEDDDEDMDDHPPPPVITRHPAPSKSKAQTIVSAPPAGTLKSVESKEMEDDDDEELSELDSQEDDELEGNDEEDEEDEEEDEEDESDEDDENSRSATPDLSKLTKRQRGQFVESEGPEANDLMALSNEALKKKQLTAEEHVQRRVEMARRRKNLSEKRNEEEKMDTINKLLHKQAPKRRTRAEMEAARAAEAGETPAAERDANALNPMYVRWVNRKEGSLVCVPKDRQEGPVGEQFGFSSHGSGRMVEEVQ